MRTCEKKWFCLFKLSDLGMFKSFPRFLLKKGFEITLELDASHAFVWSDPVVGVHTGAGDIWTLL